MRLLQLCVTLTLVVILASCEDSTTEENATARISEEKESISNVEDLTKTKKDSEGDTSKIVEKESTDVDDEERLPILPPIILLDFANDLDNSSISGEEKSKRTVDGSIGHGFARNNFFTGKYNYYFPAGKSGTSVSIEESISPFLPKTIIESVKPITEKTHPEEEKSNAYGQNPLQKNIYQSFSGIRPAVQSPEKSVNRFVAGQSVYGQRTRLYKPSQIDGSVYQTFTTTSKPLIDSYATPRPDHRSNPTDLSENSNFYSDGYFNVGRTTQRPNQVYSTQAPSFVTPTDTSYRTIYKSNPASSFVTSRPLVFDGPTTARPSNQVYSTESPLASFANLPRYTIENGVRYENKIVWKYPDGKVSQSPPSSYVNAYKEFLARQRQGPVSGSASYQSIGSGNQQIPGGVASYQPSQNEYLVPPRENRYPADASSNIHSKSPAQFPIDQSDRPSRPSQFVSSASLAANNYPNSAQQVPQQLQSYEASIQGQYGQKTSVRTNDASGYSGLSNDGSKISQNAYESANYQRQRPLSKYAINSPDPEYTYPTDSPLKSTTSSASLLTPSGKLSPEVLSKYSSEAQKYLTKVFATGTSALPSSYSKTYDVTPPTPSYAPTSPENLLNYHPSITQYIRDPSSILNAQPTFIQAGNSLIPVIILRVDGARPIQPRPTPNINLKALLQQYLSQYAGRVYQNANYETGNHGNIPNSPSSQNPSQNPLYELTQLAQSLTRYSENPSIVDHFAKRLESNLKKNSYDNSLPYSVPSNYGQSIDDYSKNDDKNNYGGKSNKQKVKSVQIIEDPRFTSYKINS